jgi:calmodulin
MSVGLASVGRTTTVDQAWEALSAAKEYDEYALVINAMPLEAAVRACEQEGILPNDTSVLGLRTALLLHFCGPPPAAAADEDARAARGARAQQMRRGKRSRRGDREANRSRVPIWALQAFRELAGEPPLEADDFTEIIAQMAWQEAHVACRRLGVQVDGLSGDEVRKALHESFVKRTDDEALGVTVRMRAEDYRAIVTQLSEEQAKAACKARGIVPVDWTLPHMQAALRAQLLGPVAEPQQNRRSFKSAVKSAVMVAKSQGKTPFEKWRNFRSAQDESADLERAKRIFEGIDLDRSGELDRNEVRELGAQLGAEMTEEELQSAMDEMDADKSGEIDLDEFLSWWQGARASRSTWARMIDRKERQEKEREWLWDLFDHIDEDGNGTLDLGELGQMTNDLGLSLTTMELSEAMSDMDRDNNGDVEFDEFFTWYVEASEKGGSGLAAEIQRGLQRSEMLQISRNAVFAAMNGKSMDHLRLLFVCSQAALPRANISSRPDCF